MFFKNELKKRIKNEKGLTLIELLAVIVILAIIAAIAIPAIGNIIANSRSKAVISDAQNALNAANIYFTDNTNKTVFTNIVGDTDLTSNFKEYLESEGGLTDIKVTKAVPNKITFKAEVKGTKNVQFTDITLDQLNSATVEKGVIKIGTTSYPPTP